MEALQRTRGDLDERWDALLPRLDAALAAEARQALEARASAWDGLAQHLQRV
jgi:hypothetical protein